MKFCDATRLQDEQRTWLNSNYDFLTQHWEAIGFQQVINLSENQKYIRIDTKCKDLLNSLIRHQQYALNKENLCIIANYLLETNNINPDNLNLSRIKTTNNEDFVSYVRENLASCLELFSTTINDEDEDQLLFILNDKTIIEKNKIDYLKKQQTRINDIDKVADDYKNMSIELFLIEPTWKNVASYFNFSGNNESNILNLYIEHYKVELKRFSCEVSIEIKEELFNYLFVSNRLELNTNKSLLDSFDNVIDNHENLEILEIERLNFLIDAGRINYTAENTSAISSRETSTFAKYLIYHKADYLRKIDEFNYTTDLALFLLRSDAFTISEKSQIAALLPLDVIEGDGSLATEICSLLTKNPVDLKKNILATVINISHNTNDRVIVAASIIERNPDDMDFIEALLNQLPYPYSDIAKHDRKHPILEKTDYNIVLLETLKNVEYISTFKETEKGLKVNKKVL